jgi:hypothetical protein
MTILDLLRDTRLCGGLPAFRDLSTWKAWLVFLAAVWGLPRGDLAAVGVDADEALQIFQRHTHRQAWPPPGGVPEACAIVGVQSGKTKIMSLCTDFAALTGEPGTYAVGFAQDHRNSMRVLLRYAREPFTTLNVLKREVVRETADTLELRNGVRLAAYPCRPASARGIRACLVAIDELAFFTATDGRPTDLEMLRVARGRLATTGGKLIVASSPYAQSGALWDLHRRHYGREDSPTLIWQATAPEMNPTLPTDYLQRMEVEDPEAYTSEVAGQFRAGLSLCFDPEALAACVVAGVRERAPEPGRTYVAHFDASGGRRDAAALAIAHHDGGRGMLDALRAWPAPHNPASAVAEACALLRAYRLHEVTGDRYSAEFVVDAFRAHVITYRASERDTSTLFLELLPLVNAERVQLLDRPDLLRELRMLERRRGSSSGRDRVSHPPSGHDDRAAAVAGCLTRVAGTPREMQIVDWRTGQVWTAAEYAKHWRAASLGLPLGDFNQGDPIVRH